MKKLLSKNKAAIIRSSAIVLVIILLVALYIYQKKSQSSSPISNSEQGTAGMASTTPPKIIPEYVKITGGCGPYYSGICAKVYAKAATSSKVVAELRNDIVLRVGSKSTSTEGVVWYKIQFEKIDHPERVTSDWYIPEKSVQVFALEDEVVGRNTTKSATSTKKEKRIVIDVSEQKLYAYEDDTLFLETSASTGYNMSPTPVGKFSIQRKTPSRYMQGPQPEFDVYDYFDLPGVPWTMYFDNYGNAIHGAYWHTKFGRRYSHGCVNLPPEKAEMLYKWATLGTKVVVRE